MQKLVLHLNRFSGSVPHSLMQLSQLRLLFYPRNSLSSTIPTTLGKLSALQWLHLFENSLSGSIPSQVGQLTRLEHIYLHMNRLEGSSSPSFSNLQNLTAISIFANRDLDFDLTLLVYFTQLEAALATSCNIRGTLPNRLPYIHTRLHTLLLNNNKLSGTIAFDLLASLGNHLETIELSSNPLSGTLPSSLGLLSNLRTLLANNLMLSGSLPHDSDWNFDESQVWKLRTMSVSRNYFVGPTVDNGPLHSLETLIMSANYFSCSVGRCVHDDHCKQLGTGGCCYVSAMPSARIVPLRPRPLLMLTPLLLMLMPSLLV